MSTVKRVAEINSVTFHNCTKVMRVMSHWSDVVHVWSTVKDEASPPSILFFLSVQCSSWRQVYWSTPSASIHHWSGPSAGNLTSTMPANVRSAGATCSPLSESCSLFSCPFLPNMHRRSSCPPPLYPRSYRALANFSVFISFITALS